MTKCSVVLPGTVADKTGPVLTVVGVALISMVVQVSAGPSASVLSTCVRHAVEIRSTHITCIAELHAYMHTLQSADYSLDQFGGFESELQPSLVTLTCKLVFSPCEVGCDSQISIDGLQKFVQQTNALYISCLFDHWLLLCNNPHTKSNFMLFGPD